MKRLMTILVVTLGLSGFAQWPNFNRVQLNIDQSPPFDYWANAGFKSVFPIDRSGIFYDGYLLFGQGVLRSPSVTDYHTQVFVSSVNVEGDLIWSQQLYSDTTQFHSTWFNSYYPNGMVLNHAGLVTTTLTTFDSAIPEPWLAGSAYLAFFSEEGQMVEQTEIQLTPSHAYGLYGVIEDLSDSTYVVYGARRDSTSWANNEWPDAVMIKFNELGELEWERVYSGTFTVRQVVKAIDGGFWISAYELLEQGCLFGAGEYNGQYVLIKTSEFGIEQSRIVMGGPCGGESGELIELSEDIVLLGGRFPFEEQNEGYDYHGYFFTTILEQTNEDGPLQELDGLRKTYMITEAYSLLSGIEQFQDGYLLYGSSQSEEFVVNQPQRVGFLLKLDENRDSTWARFYRYYQTYASGWGYEEHWVWDAELTPDGGVICCGEVEQGPNGPHPFLLTPWLFKTDSLGCIEPGCQFVHVEEITIGLEQSMSVFRIPPLKHVIFAMIHCAFCGHENKNKLGRAFVGLA